MKIFIHTVNQQVGYDSKSFSIAFANFLGLSDKFDFKSVDSPRSCDLILVIDMHMASPYESYRKLLESDLYKRYHSCLLVYDESDRPMVFGRGLYVSMPRLFFNHNNHVAIPYWNSPTDVYSHSSKALGKEYRISFRGNCKTHKVRTSLKSIDFDGYCFIDTSDENAHKFAAYGDSYIDLLLKSEWSLCPRGNGTASFRLYESVALGIPPVVVSNQFVPPKVLQSVDVRYLDERKVSVDNLSNLIREKPVTSKPITREDIAANICDAIQSFTPTNYKLNPNYLQLNRVIWKLFSNIV